MLERFKNLKVAIGVPSNGYWVTDFGISLNNMLLYCNNARVGNYKSQIFQLNSVKGSILPKMRREIVKNALEMDADYLMWLDSDHTFPRNIIHRLISHGKDVVAANCVTKSLPSSPTGRHKPKEGDPVQGLPMYTDTDSPELERVWRIGTGIMLVDMKVFRKTGANIFDMFFREEVDAYQGEDWTMCEAIEKAGFTMWVDHPLSDQCEHVGLFRFAHEHVGSLEKVKEFQNLQVAHAVKDAFPEEKPVIQIVRK